MRWVRLGQRLVEELLGGICRRLSAGLETGVQRHSSVDIDRRADDVIGEVGSQPNGYQADLLDFADPLRDQLHQRGVGI